MSTGEGSSLDNNVIIDNKAVNSQQEIPGAVANPPNMTGMGNLHLNDQINNLADDNGKVHKGNAGNLNANSTKGHDHDELASEIDPKVSGKSRKSRATTNTNREDNLKKGLKKTAK